MEGGGQNFCRMECGAGRKQHGSSLKDELRGAPSAESYFEINQLSVSSVSTCASESFLDLFEQNSDELKEQQTDGHFNASAIHSLPGSQAEHSECDDLGVPPDPDTDDYDVVQAIAEFAKQRLGDAAQQRAEDVAMASACLFRQATCLERASQRVHCAPKVRAHYNRVRVELLQELDALTGSDNPLGAPMLDAIPQVNNAHLQSSRRVQHKLLDTQLQILSQTHLRSEEIQTRGIKRLADTLPASEQPDAKRNSISDVADRYMLLSCAEDCSIPDEARVQYLERRAMEPLENPMKNIDVCHTDFHIETAQTYSDDVDVYATYFCE